MRYRQQKMAQGSKTGVSARHAASTSFAPRSERVVLNNRNVLNRDVDYFMSYTRPGLLVFFFVTPSTQDAISVEYRYQSATGIARAGQASTGTSHKLGWMFSPTSSMRFSGDLKKLQPEFRPLGVARLGSGSNALSNKLEISPNPMVNVVADWKERNDQIGTTAGFLAKQVDQSYALNMKPPGVGEIAMTYRTLRSNDNALQIPGAPFAQTVDSTSKYSTLQFQSSPWQKGPLALDGNFNFTRTDTDNNLARLFQ